MTQLETGVQMVLAIRGDDRLAFASGSQERADRTENQIANPAHKPRGPA